MQSVWGRGGRWWGLCETSGKNLVWTTKFWQGFFLSLRPTASQINNGQTLEWRLDGWEQGPRGTKPLRLQGCLKAQGGEGNKAPESDWGSKAVEDCLRSQQSTFGSFFVGQANLNYLGNSTSRQKVPISTFLYNNAPLSFYINFRALPLNEWTRSYKVVCPI